MPDNPSRKVNRLSWEMSDSRLTEEPAVSVGLEVAWAVAGGNGSMEVGVDVAGRDVAAGLQAEKTRLRGNKALKIQKLRLMISSFCARLPGDLY